MQGFHRDPHLKMRREKWDSSLVLARHSVFLLRGDGYVGELLELHQSVKDPFEAQREGGMSLEKPQCKSTSSRVESTISRFSRAAAGKLGFLSSYNGEFWDPLMWPQESPVSMRVGRGLLRFLSNRSQVLGPYLELSPEPQVSSPVLT